MMYNEDATPELIATVDRSRAQITLRIVRPSWMNRRTPEPRDGDDSSVARWFPEKVGRLLADITDALVDQKAIRPWEHSFRFSPVCTLVDYDLCAEAILVVDYLLPVVRRPRTEFIETVPDPGTDPDEFYPSSVCLRADDGPGKVALCLCRGGPEGARRILRCVEKRLVRQARMHTPVRDRTMAVVYAARADERRNGRTLDQLIIL
jgi:hypothetical protein